MAAEGGHRPRAGRQARSSSWRRSSCWSATFLLVAVVPFGPDAFFTNFDAGVFFVLAVSSISALGILIAGWACANKYSLLGGLRAAGQLIAYELPMVLAVVGVVIQAGTLNMQGIVVRPERRRRSSAGTASATRTSSPSSSAS